MFFVLKDDQIVGQHMTQMEAEAQYRFLIGQRWPNTRSASIYTAECRHQMQDFLDKAVQLVCAGVGAGYWDSPEGREQRERDADQEERDLAEDLA